MMQTAQTLALTPGLVLGTLVFSKDAKRNKSMVVESVSRNGLAARLRGKRGSATVHVDTDALAIRAAIDRAFERGQRRDNYDAFVAARRSCAAPVEADARCAGDGWRPQYSPWRHGGWYVDNVRYPSGAYGCVSRNYPDRKWRIVHDPRRTDLGARGDHTFKTRDEAAMAERVLAAKDESEIEATAGEATAAVEQARASQKASSVPINMELF